MKAGFDVLDVPALDAMTLDEVLSYQKTVCSQRRKSEWIDKATRVLFSIETVIGDKADQHETINENDFMEAERFVEMLHQGLGEDTSGIILEEGGQSLGISSSFYDVGDCLFVKGCLDEEIIITLSLKTPVSDISEVEPSNIEAIEDICYYYVDKEQTCCSTSVTVKGLKPEHLHRFIECLQIIDARIERRTAWDESSMAADELLCYAEYK